jgi:hypothetical protein
MSKPIVIVAGACACALFGSSRAPAAAPLIWDESALVTNSTNWISSSAYANDFVVAAATRLRSADVILVDSAAGDDGLLGSFSGVLGWAVYEDSSGAPGALVAKGQSTGVSLADTHLQAFGGSYDMVRAHFELDRLVSLAPGTYWFALREGTWGDGTDGSELQWAVSPNSIGAVNFFSLDEQNASSWSENSGGTDNAFVLYGDAVVWDESPFSTGAGSINISNFVIANDFSLGAPEKFSSLETWLLDQDQAGPFDRFSGALSWAIYDDAAGAPGTIVDFGSGVAVRVTDAGVLGQGDAAIAHVELSFGRALALDAGTWWLALHEGSWLSPADGSVVAWVRGDTSAGAAPSYSSNLNPPGPWTSNAGSDGSFVLSDQLIFGSGFDNGTLCAWDGVAGPCG